jgi:hypothetical protein
MVLIDLIVNGQTCVAQNNFAQHDWSCMGRIRISNLEDGCQGKYSDRLLPHRSLGVTKTLICATRTWTPQTSDSQTVCRKRMARCAANIMKVYFNKKFWEELIAYFL